MTDTKIKVTIDPENNAEIWWNNGGHELWAKFFGDPMGVNEGVLSAQMYHDFFKRAQQIPGFINGPEYAPTPFMVDCDHNWLAGDTDPVGAGSQGYGVRCANCHATGYQRAGWYHGRYRRIGEVIID